jgi:hypothetical protein
MFKVLEAVLGHPQFVTVQKHKIADIRSCLEEQIV